MGESLIDRIDDIARSNVKHTTISLASNDYSWLSQGVSSTASDLRDNKYDHALAYLYVEPVRDCIDLYAQSAGKVPYILKRGDKEIARSDDPSPRHDFIRMLRNHRKNYYIGFFNSVIYERILHDELFLEMLYPDASGTRLSVSQSNIINGVRVLRGAGVSPTFYHGKLQSLTYSGDDIAGMINPSDIIYDKGYNSLSDYRGASRMQAVLEEVNIVNRLRAWLKRHLLKVDRPDVYVGAKDTQGFGEEAWKKTKEALQRYKSDPNANIFGGSLPLDFTTIPRPDANNQLEIDDKTRAAIFRGFRVHPALVGDTQDTSYKQEHPAIYSTWIKTELLSLLIEVDEVINDNLLPRIFPKEKDLRLEHDISEFDIVTDDDKAKVESANSQLVSGAITYGQHAEMLGRDIKDVPAEIRDCVQVEGVPVALGEVAQLARWKFQAPAIADFAQAEASVTDNNTPATNDSGDIAPQDMTVQYDENGTAIPQTEVFGYHIESGIVDVNEARAQLGLPPLEKEVSNDTDLVQLNSQLQTVITAINAGMSIEEAYESVGLPVPKQEDEPPPPPDDMPDEAKQKSLSISHGDHNHTIGIKAFNPVQETPDAELSAWRTVALKSAGKRDFEPIWLAGDIADSLLDSIKQASGDKVLIAKAFDEARVVVATKAIQATRLDFENDFDSLMEKARKEGNNFGRVQWSSAMRSIVRRYGKRAYIDGLNDGGVQGDELSEADQDTIADLQSEQSVYISNLGAAIFKSKDGISDALADQKAAQWFNGSVNPFYQSGILSADKNGMYEWVLGNTEKHCDDCKRLDGQRHRWKDWMRKIGGIGVVGQNTECEGHRCDCKGQKVNASARGKY